jgi:ketose-bisphosphate aldolase
MYKPVLGVSLKMILNEVSKESCETLFSSRIATCEISPDLFINDISGNKKEIVKQALNSNNVRVPTIHALFGQQYDFSSLDNDVFQGAIAEVVKAIDIGFSSVMIDASRYDFEENIKRTKEVSAYAHRFNVSVEAELGSVGNEGETRSTKDIEDNMTKSQMAKEFVERTNCDALAVAIGNAHGPYVKYPSLDFNRLSEIHEILDMPLVLHGGSGTSEEDFKEVIRRGISKVNVATAIHNAAGEAMKDASNNNYFETVKQIEKNVEKVIETHMKIFESEGKT